MSHRIVLVTGALDCGGAQRVMSDMANYWAAMGWQIMLVTWSGAEPADFYALNAEITRVRLGDDRGGTWLDKLRTTARRLHGLRAVLRTFRPQAVLSFIDISNIHTIVATRRMSVRVIVSERTHPGLNRELSGHWQLLRKICYRFADRVVAQTDDAAAWLARHCSTRTLVIPNPVRELPSPTGPREPLVVAVGRLSREKGFDVLLDAFASIYPSYPQWRLCVLGAGPERATLLAQVARLGLGDCVDFPGQIANIEAWLARAALMVHPSRREGFPNAVLEAMAMGVAVICADSQPGLRALINDGINGRLVPVDDVAALARVMFELMGDSAARERLGVQAVEVRQRYSQSGVMKLWEACVLR